MGPMIQQVQSTCGSCRGTGKEIVANNKCDTCGTNGYILRDVTVDVPLKNGLTHGHQIQLENVGHNLKSGKTDVIIVINEKPHTIFKRDGSNLLIDVELALFQALFGFDKIIKHLDGRELLISHTGVTDYGTKRQILGEGMSDLRFKTKGDLIINFKIKLPSIIDPDIIQTLQNNLRELNKKEADSELEIRINNSKYIKTIMNNYTEYDKTSQDHQGHQGHQSHQGHQGHQGHHGPRVSVEGHQTCQQQ
jgi:DnaJ-class molecular chaperone